MQLSQPKPLIGINGTLLAGHPGERPNFCVRTTYLDSVQVAGGIPIVLPALPIQELVEKFAALCDGFVFVGGPDIPPARYKMAEVNPTVCTVPERREAFDFQLMERVLQLRKPFLAVCLGCQELNVLMGGTLIQDIASEIDAPAQHSTKQAPHFLRQTVQVEPNTLLAELVGPGELAANSAHHQAVGVLAPGLRVSAISPEDGIIECFEVVDYPFGLAVQWHPEVLALDERPHLRIFEGLVEAATASAVAEN